MTSGVKINNHGDCSYFRKKVDRFKEIFKRYQNTDNNDLLASGTVIGSNMTNLKIEGTNFRGGDSSPAMREKTKLPTESSPIKLRNMNDSDSMSLGTRKELHN